MAYFAVTLETIKTSEKHPNADKLSVCTLDGVPFTFVTGINQFEVGEQVIYFPIDSIVPDPIAEKLGVFKKLSGSNKDRIKTCTIRGTISQGIVGKFTLIEDCLIQIYGNDWMEKGIEIKPSEITTWLGVTKYEPPVIADKAGRLITLPDTLSIYDIESCERYGKVVSYLMDKKVWVLEKMEGSNGSIHYDTINDKMYVNQRRFTIEEIDGHKHGWWEVARKQGFVDFVQWVAKTQGGSSNVTLYFECCGPGIQGNLYSLKEVTGYIFDMKVNGFFISKPQMFALLDTCFVNGYVHAPVLGKDILLRDWLNGKSIKDASNGTSVVANVLREGIVISPSIEEYNEDLGGRLIIKQRDPIYLSKTSN